MSDLFDEIRLLDLRQVAELVGRSTDTVDDWVRRKLFPSPIQARAGSKKQWRYATVLAWIEKRQRTRYVAPKPRGKLKQDPRYRRYQDHE